MNKNKFNQDYSNGMKSEISVLKILNEFGFDVKKTAKSHPFDFYNDENYFELKSRNVYKNTYPTTIIGLNKIEFAKKTDKVCIFLFKFIDGLYFYIYDKDDINNKINIGGRSDRGIDEYKPYFHIPISSLNPIESLKSFL